MRLRILPIALASLAAACGGSEPTAAKAPPLSGRYVLETFNGLAMPAQPAAGVVIDTGYATLWSSGYYELYVREIANGLPFNYVLGNGHWLAGPTDIQLAGSSFNSGILFDSAKLLGNGRFTVEQWSIAGRKEALGFHRYGDEPPPPIRPFDATAQPSYSASFATTGSGSAMTLEATLTAGNSDVIDRMLTFPSPCPVYLWLTTDSMRFTSATWTDYYDDPQCLAAGFTDTIPKGGRKSYIHRRTVAEMKLFGGTVPAPGRYYVWLVSELKISTEPGMRLGWVTIGN